MNMTRDEVNKNIAEGILDLELIKKEFEDQEWEEDDYEENLIKRVFLGSTLSIMPSGKYYLPFACSNVESCPTCEGEGHLPNPASDPKKMIALINADQILTKFEMENRGAWCSGKWDKDVNEIIDLLRKAGNTCAETLDCETCGTLGSEEAYLDSLYQEALEKEVESIGASLESGEGDPLDLFAVITKEKEEEE